MNKTKKFVDSVICKSDTISGKLFNIVMIFIILANTLAIIFESFKPLYLQYQFYFQTFELVSIFIFTVEYLLRVWIADMCGKTFRERNLLRMRYVFSFMSVIDLLSILPFFLPMLFPIDLRFIRILRVTRLFRIFKLNRYSKAMGLIGKVVKESKEQLISTIFILVLLIMISSTLIYYIENPAQPDKFPNIVASFWWAVATLTTVGYGDIYPITGIGKLLSSIIAVLGIGLVALPTGIISSGFMNEIKSEKVTHCPHCNTPLE